MKQKASRKKNKSQFGASQKLSGKLIVLLAAVCAVVLAAGFFVDLSGITSAKRSVAPVSLRFSEYQSDNSSVLFAQNGDTPDWIELVNTGSETVSLKGITIAKDTQLNKAFVFPDRTLAPGEIILIFADGTAGEDGDLHAAFRLSASGGETLSLFDGSRNLLDQVETVELRSDASCGRNEAGEWEISAIASPGSKNSFLSETEAQAVELEAAPGDVEFSEAVSANIMVFPDENGAFHDYIELHNVTAHSVNLEGYFLSDNAASLLKWKFPRVILPANGYLAVHCSGEDRASDSTHLHTNFRLSSEGEHLFLCDASQTLIASVTLPALEAGQSYSRVDGAWTDKLAPTPNLENTAASILKLDADRLEQNRSGVYISEIMALPDENGSCDWLELTNDTDASVDLSGCGLSDNPERRRKWQFPAGTSIGAHEVLTVLLPGAEGAPVQGFLNADFALSADGGYPVCLSSPDGALLDSVYLPVQYTDISYGRTSRGGSLGYYAVPTPNAVNTTATLPARAKPAQISVPGGVFRSGESFNVSLSAEPGARIYYTLDCTDPDESSPLYSGTPIPVDHTTILRTRVYRDGYLESLTDTHSYLFDVNNAADVPYVVSLVSDPDNLYSDERGIMVKGPNAWDKFPYGDTNRGANFWMDWEREAHIELFAGGAETAISQNCGIKMHGRNTRAYELQSFKVVAKECYGDGLFRYPIFSDRDFTDCDSFLLRYTGQDYKYTFLRDPVFTSLAADTGVLYQETEECVVYLNGQYYSAMYLRETVDPHFICQCNGWEGMEDEIDLVRGAISLIQGSDDDFLALREYLETHDAAAQETYDRIAAIVDIDNFIEYAVFTIVMEPPDTVDVKRYRNPYGDGKWRWIVYDFDRCLRGDLDGFELMAQGSYRGLFKAFMTNPTLRERFLDYFAASLATTYSAQNMRDRVQEQYERIKPLLPDYLANLGLSQGHYNSKLKALVNRIGRAPKLAIEQCAKYMNLSEEEVSTRFADAIRAINEYEANNQAE